MPSAEVISPDYVLDKHLAAELDICLRTLVRWRKARKGPPVTFIGRTAYYRRAAIREWLLAREGSPRINLSRPSIEATPRQRNARRHNARRIQKKV
jgi:hypothetical protein